MKGYSRDHFPHWRDTGKNCDVRDSILQRDGKDVKLSGCNVVGGRWESVYDGRSFADPSDVDIDHMVPLANAWRSGADEWDDAQARRLRQRHDPSAALRGFRLLEPVKG